MFGRIIIGDKMAIGANAVINSDFPDGNATIGGIPAKTISQKIPTVFFLKVIKNSEVCKFRVPFRETALRH